MSTIALVGAGGKMGCRIADNLMKGSREVRYVEIHPAGIARLSERGITPVKLEEGVADADIVVLAVPDTAIEHH